MRIIISIFFFVGTSMVAQAQGFTKSINSKTGLLVVKNEHCGVVVPWTKTATTKNFDLAPIQSFIYKDGVYSDTSINILHTGVKSYAFEASILTENKKQLTIQLWYKFKKPQFFFGKETYKGGEAGEGYYKVWITLWANSKTITIEEDLTYDVSFEIEINNGLNASNGRY